MKKINLILLFAFFYCFSFSSLDFGKGFLDSIKTNNKQIINIFDLELILKNKKILDFRKVYFNKISREVIDLNYLYTFLPSHINLKFVNDNNIDLISLKFFENLYRKTLFKDEKKVFPINIKEKEKIYFKKIGLKSIKKKEKRKESKFKRMINRFNSMSTKNTIKNGENFVEFLRDLLDDDNEESLKTKKKRYENFIKINVNFEKLRKRVSKELIKEKKEIYKEKEIPIINEKIINTINRKNVFANNYKQLQEKINVDDFEKIITEGYGGILNIRHSPEYEFFVNSVIDLTEIYNLNTFSFYDRLVVKNLVYIMLDYRYKPVNFMQLCKDYDYMVFDSGFDDIREYLKYVNLYGLNDSQMKYLMIYASIACNLEPKEYPDTEYSKRDVYNYLISSNYYDVINTFNRYDILKIKFFKTDDKELNFSSTQNVYNKIKDNVDIINIADSLKDINVKLYFKFGTIDFPIEEFDSLKEYFANNVNNKIIGPIYKNNKISIIRIFDINNKFFKEEDLQIKVMHYFIKKSLNKEDGSENKFERDINLYKINRVLSLLTAEKTECFMKKNSYIEFLNKTNSDPFIFNSIKNLKKNEITPILELDDGWHILIVLGKEFNIDSELYKQIVDNIAKKCKRNHKSDFISQNLERIWYLA